MRNGTCPKCHSTEIYTGEYLNGFVKAGIYWANTLPIAFFTDAALDNYVCAKCGFVESYIIDHRKLRAITEKWPRSTPSYELGTGRSGELPAGRDVTIQKTCPGCQSALPQEWKACPHCGQSMV